MTSALAGWLQLGLLVAALAACYIPLGNYIAKVFTTEKHWRVERGIYRLTGIDPAVDQRWSAYLRSVLAFSAASVLFLYGMQRLQHYLLQFVGPPMANVTPATAFNTAVSFTTNTNWQNYSGESTMTYIVQMSGLAVQNFVSAVRRKLEPEPARPRWLLTEPGMGYRYQPDDDEQRQEDARLPDQRGLSHRWKSQHPARPDGRPGTSDGDR